MDEVRSQESAYEGGGAGAVARKGPKGGGQRCWLCLVSNMGADWMDIFCL